MISAAALETFLRATNPIVDWSITIAALSQVAGAMTAASAPLATTSSQPPPVLPTPVPETATKTTMEPLPRAPITATAPKVTELAPQLSLTKQLDVSPISAYRPPTAREGNEGAEEEGEEPEEEAKIVEEETVEERATTEETARVEPGETPTEGGVEKEKAEEADLDELAKKQGLMSEEEFEKLMDGRGREGRARNCWNG